MNFKGLDRFACCAILVFFYCFFLPLQLEAAATIENIYYEQGSESGSPIRVVIEGKNLQEVEFSPWDFPEESKSSEAVVVEEESLPTEEPEGLSFLDRMLLKETSVENRPTEPTEPESILWKLVMTQGKPNKKLTVMAPLVMTVIDKMSLSIETPSRPTGRWGQAEDRIFTAADKKAGRKFDRVEYVFTLNSRPEFVPVNNGALKGKVIILDPGHGGRDVGAVGPGETFEKDVNLAVSLQLEAELKKWGARPIMTRSIDTDAMDELGDRVQVCTKNQGDAFVSLHSDAALNKQAKGFTVYFYKPKGKRDLLLANSVRAGLREKVMTQDRGVRTANFYVVKRNSYPSVLIEMGFISNAEEEVELMNPEYQQDLVEGTVQGLAEYFSHEPSIRLAETENGKVVLDYQSE